MKDFINGLIDLGRKHVTFINKPKCPEYLTMIEQVEFAGHLLRRDLTLKSQDIGNILVEICEAGGYAIMDCFAAICCDDSLEIREDLARTIQANMVKYYAYEMQDTLDQYWENMRWQANYEAGHVIHKNLQTGEETWTRR